MSIRSDDRHQIENEVLAGTRLGHNIFCKSCGYNLRTLPYVGLCTECGSEYNAHALSMKGIFLADRPPVPIPEMLGFVICGTGAVSLLESALNPYIPEAVLLAVLVGACCLLFAYQTFQKARTLWQFQKIYRRIRQQEEDMS